jgi:tRNA A-37 threonylcarbamoyl transferase component Bud32
LIPATDSELKLAKYELLGELGHGGMATVYRARDRRLGRDVAIKVIHRHLRENPEVARRFASEALAVAKVKHPNIVEVYDVSADDEAERYLVVEYVDGVTLRQRLREVGPFPPEIAAAIAREVCDALGQAHRNGVIHRDVKPENVLLKLDGGSDGALARVKLTDFGIAKLLDAQGVTHTGQVLGSPAHMAPEQIEGGDVDARADVFGAGVLFYEMLTGTLPFEGQNPAQVLRRVLDGTFLPAERVRPHVGAAYGRIVARALARDPADRFPSAQAFAAALEAELAALGIVDARAEISRFVLDPDGYGKHHRQQIVERISARGAEARDSGDVMQAAACFNRALAYRPDDTELLAEVAGLARRGRLRKRVARGMAALLLLGVSGMAVYLGLSVLTVPAGLPVGRAAPPASGGKKKAEAPAVPQPRPPLAGVEPAPTTPQKSPASGAPARPQLAKPVRALPEGVRLVRTPVVGPQNARVRIDGALEPWFQVHSLSFGPHTFEFVPPNSDCCEAPAPMTVEVVPGQDAQIVRGVIQFKPATLMLSAPAGSHASCGLGEVIAAGSSQTIPMDRPARDLTCTVVPPSGSSDPPKRVDVGLRPGRTFTLTWP